jgi:hypothetical protein
LSARLLQSILPSKGCQEFPFSRDPRFFGIIHYLTTRCGGNGHSHGVIEVSAKKVHTGPVANVADVGNDSHFWSPDEPDHYSLQSSHNSPYLVTWLIEWTELDRQTKRKDLSGHFQAGDFKVANPQEVRMIRLRQPGKASDNCTDWLGLSRFELFGSLIQ